MVVKDRKRELITALKGQLMVKVIKLFVFTAALLVAAFIANFFGLLSIPWLDVNSVATYGDHAIRADEAVQKIHDQ